jgi:hypothetical protein
MDGYCDVKGCTEPTFMGWRPLTERLGRQICEYHWLRHKDPEDSFDLFDAFGFRRPLPKPLPKVVAEREPELKVKLCGCGKPLRPRCQYCTSCAAERERLRKQEWRAQQESPEDEPQQEAPRLQCRQCGAQRRRGHTYCNQCAERRKKQLHREHQRKYAKQAG